MSDDATQRLAAAYAMVFDRENLAGQMVLQHLIMHCHMLETTYEPGDSHHSAYREGRRSVVLDIFRMLRWSAERMRDLGEGVEEDEVFRQRYAEMEREAL